MVDKNWAKVVKLLIGINCSCPVNTNCVLLCRFRLDMVAIARVVAATAIIAVNQEFLRNSPYNHHHTSESLQLLQNPIPA